MVSSLWFGSTSHLHMVLSPTELCSVTLIANLLKTNLKKYYYKYSVWSSTQMKILSSVFKTLARKSHFFSFWCLAPCSNEKCFGQHLVVFPANPHNLLLSGSAAVVCAYMWECVSVCSSAHVCTCVCLGSFFWSLWPKSKSEPRQQSALETRLLIL